MKDDIRESMNKLIKLNEGQLNVDGKLFDIHKKPNGQAIFAGQEGILGKDNKIIDWEFIKDLMFKYNKYDNSKED
jgi:hypothetical protein